MHNIFSLLIIFLLFSISVADEVKYENKIPAIPLSENKATLVFVRDDGKGPKTSDEVAIYRNTEFINISYERSTSITLIAPGEIMLCLLYDNDEDQASVIKKNFEAGKIYFIYVNVYSTFNAWSGIQGGVEATLISKEDALKHISEREDHLQFATNLETLDDLEADDYDDVMDEYNDYVKNTDNVDKINANNMYAGYTE